MFYLFFLIAFFVFITQKAYAYLDPGSGSFIMQIIIGAILGGLVTIKIYFHKVKSFFIKFFHRRKKDNHRQKTND
jgi:hypothetical protein